MGAGVLVLYVPTFADLGRVYWNGEDGAHGPLLLAVFLWLVWRKRDVLIADGEGRPRSGFAFIVPGLLLYVAGRALTLPIFELAGLMPMLAGVVAAMRGWRAARALWFPILFAAFLIPLPGVLVDSVTGPLKAFVSVLAEQILYAAGYPVARSGVVITIGPYQLLVADACAGLHSMFSLAALGVLFVYVTDRASLLHNALMVVSILPIAFLANLVRVLLLLLITFHLGDEAGQGFLHAATGIVLFLVAVTGLLVLDRGLMMLPPLQAARP